MQCNAISTFMLIPLQLVNHKGGNWTDVIIIQNALLHRVQQEDSVSERVRELVLYFGEEIK